MAGASRSGAEEGGAEEPAAVELEGWRAPEEARSVANPVEADEASLERGLKLYKRACAKCHGAEGKGDGRVSKMLDTQPADLSARVPYQSDGELYWKLTEGRQPMPAFGKDLSAEQLWDLVNYLRMLAPGEDASEDDGASEGDEASEGEAAPRNTEVEAADPESDDEAAAPESDDAGAAPESDDAGAAPE
jgi:mono/diheme cytochrome c family protein